MIAFWAILTARIEMPALEALGQKDPSKLSEADWDQVRRALGNQKLLGMDYYSGGHLTHGYRRNLSAKMFEAHSYAVSRDTGLLDYDAIAAKAREVKPFILLAGYSAYPRAINFKRMRAIADRWARCSWWTWRTSPASWRAACSRATRTRLSTRTLLPRPRTKPCAVRAAASCCARRNSRKSWTKVVPS
jgi:hypothetical protein